MSDSSLSAAPLLDYSQLEPLVEIGFDEIRDILDSMLLEAPPQLDALAAAIVSGDAVSGRAKAHSVRGMVLNFGCAALAERLSLVERAPDFPGGDPVGIVQDLAALWQRTRVELQGWAAAQSGQT